MSKYPYDYDDPGCDSLFESDRQAAYRDAMLDAEADRIQDCILSGDCCCPTEPPSRYDPGGIIRYLDECPEHGEG